MSRYKNYRVHTRNWDALAELDDIDTPLFEPIRSFKPEDGEAKPRRVPRLRHSYHRPRFG